MMLREESSQPTFILARCSRLRGFNKLERGKMRRMMILMFRIRKMIMKSMRMIMRLMTMMIMRRMWMSKM